MTTNSLFKLCRLIKWAVLLMSLIQLIFQLRKPPNWLRRSVDRLLQFPLLYALFNFLQTCHGTKLSFPLLSGSYRQMHHAFSVSYRLWCNCHYCREGTVFILSMNLTMLWIFFPFKTNFIWEKHLFHELIILVNHYSIRK
jgi:hypothetical protein